MSVATSGEVQTVVAARRLRRAKTIFIGVGRPSTAAILARMVHNPDLVVEQLGHRDHEVGRLGQFPVADRQRHPSGLRADRSRLVDEYWIGPGRIDVAFLGAAQVDRFANLNTTVIGDYERPRTRLPGAGGAPEVAAGCGEVVIVVPHAKRSLVERLDFVSTVGHGDGPGARERLGFRGRGPAAVITDLCVLEPDLATRELALTQVHPGVEVDQVQAGTGWNLTVADHVSESKPPTTEELTALRELVSR